MVSLCFTQISLCFRGHQSLSGRFTGAVQGRIGAALRQGVTVTTHRSGRDHRGSQGITGRSKISIRIATVNPPERCALPSLPPPDPRAVRSIWSARVSRRRFPPGKNWKSWGLWMIWDCGWGSHPKITRVTCAGHSQCGTVLSSEGFTDMAHIFMRKRFSPFSPCWNVQFGFLVRCLPSPSDHFPVFVNFMLKVKGAARRVSVVSAVSCQCRSSKRKSAGRLWEASRMREAGELHGVETSHENMLFRKIWKTLWTSSVMIRCDSWRSTTVFHGISTLGTVVHGVSAVCCQHEFLCQGMAGVCGWQREGATRVASIARTESWTEGATLLAIFQLNRVELNVKIGFVRICGFPTQTKWDFVGTFNWPTI